MQKGTSWAEATFNSGKIKFVAILIIELCLSEGIVHSLNHSVSQSTNQQKIPLQDNQSIGGT